MARHDRAREPDRRLSAERRLGLRARGQVHPRARRVPDAESGVDGSVSASVLGRALLPAVRILVHRASRLDAGAGTRRHRGDVRHRAATGSRSRCSRCWRRRSSAGNPLYFALANTFMTDVPFFAVSAASLYFLVRWARDPDHRAAWPGLVLAMIAILIRQAGIVIPLGFAAAYVAVRGFRGKTLAIALLPVVIGASLHFGFQAWLQQTGRTPIRGRAAAPRHRLRQSACRSPRAAAPLHLPRVRRTLRAAPSRRGRLPCLGTIRCGRAQGRRDRLRCRRRGCRCPVLFVIATPMPFLDNILNAFGVGPLTLTDTFFLRRNLPGRAVLADGRSGTC